MCYENDNLLYLFFYIFCCDFLFVSTLSTLSSRQLCYLFIFILREINPLLFSIFFHVLKKIFVIRFGLSVLSLSVWNSGHSLNCWTLELFSIWIEDLLTVPNTFAHAVKCTFEKWLIPFHFSKHILKSFLTSSLR